MTNDRVTLLCRYGPLQAGAWQPVVLEGVYFAAADGRSGPPGQPGRRSRGMLVVPYAAAAGYVSPAAWQALPPEQRAPLVGVLRQDPRPSYQDDPDRVYGMDFAGYNVRFTVAGETLTVRSVARLEQKLK